MRILINLIAALSLALPVYADISVSELPYLEGTPLDQSSQQDLSWTLLDYAEVDGSFTWVWLEKAGQLAYVTYPSSSESVVFPDGTRIESDPENMVLRFLGNEDQRLEFTRLGGSVILEGRDISMVYTAVPPQFSGDGINVELVSSGSVTTTGSISAAAITINVGETISIGGTASHPTCLQPNGAEVTISAIKGEDFSYKSPCSGDFLIAPGPGADIQLPPNSGLVILEAEETINGGEIVAADNKQTQNSPQKKSSGGNTSGLVLVLLALLALLHRRLSGQRHGH